MNLETALFNASHANFDRLVKSEIAAPVIKFTGTITQFDGIDNGEQVWLPNRTSFLMGHLATFASMQGLAAGSVDENTAQGFATQFKNFLNHLENLTRLNTLTGFEESGLRAWSGLIESTRKILAMAKDGGTMLQEVANYVNRVAREAGDHFTQFLGPEGITAIHDLVKTSDKGGLLDVDLNAAIVRTTGSEQVHLARGALQEELHLAFAE